MRLNATTTGFKTLFSSTLVFLLAATSVTAQEKVTFDDHVQPILRQKCFSCHNQNKKSSGLDLTTYTNLMLGGSSGDVLEPGSPDDSYLFLLITHESEPFMPPKSPKMPDTEINLVRKWIEQGMPENAGSKIMVPKKKKFEFKLEGDPTAKPEVPPMPNRLSKEALSFSPKTTAVSAIATNPWSPLAAVAGFRQIMLYNTSDLSLAGVLEFPEGVAQVLKFSRNGSLLMAGGGHASSTGKVIVFNVANGERVFEVGDELDSVLGADISADQSMIALGGPERMIRIYSTQDGTLLNEIKKHTDWVTQMEFSPDGILLATGDRNGGLHVWESFTGREYLTLKGHSGSISGISWRADSNILASSSEDGSIRLWEMENGGQVRNWGAHGGGTAFMSFARDGRIVSCGRDRITKVWDQGGQQQVAFAAFGDLALRCAICNETNRVIAGDWTGEIRVWNVADGAQIGTLATNPPKLDMRVQQATAAVTAADTAYKPLAEVAAASTKALNDLKAKLAAAQKLVVDYKAAYDTAKGQIETYNKEIAKLDGELKAATAVVNKLTPVVPALTESVAKAKDAAAKNAEDKEVAQLAAQLEALTNKRNTELETNKKTAAERTTALAKSKELLAKATTEMNTADAEMKKAEAEVVATTNLIKPAEEKLAADTANANAAAGVLEAAKTSLTYWQAEVQFTAQLSDLRTRLNAAFDMLTAQMQSHQDMLDAAAVAEGEFNNSNTALTDAKTTAENANVRVTTAVKTDNDAKKALDTATTNHQVATKAANALQAGLPPLSAAITSADEAVSKSGGDADLKAAADSLKALKTKKETELKAAQELLTTRTTELKTAQDGYTATQAELAKAQKALTDARAVVATREAELKPFEVKLADARTAVENAAKSVTDAESGVDTVEQEIEKLQQPS